MKEIGGCKKGVETGTGIIIFYRSLLHVNVSAYFSRTTVEYPEKTSEVNLFSDVG